MNLPFQGKSQLPLPNLIHETPTIQFDRQIDPPQGSGGADAGGSIQFPFQLQDKSAGTTAQFEARYGTVMDVEPTNCETVIALTDNTTTIIYIHVVVDDPGNFVSAEILTGAAQPADGTYDGYITIGQAITGTGIITSLGQAMTHSLRMAMCNRTVDGGGHVANPGSFEFWGF